MLLDCAMSGGYAVGRISNIVGDRSSGKTLLAIEACLNYHAKFPDGDIFYVESEAAFDKSYAEALGMPVDKVTFVEDLHTVEDLFKFLLDTVADNALVVVDSLDALSDKSEMEMDIDQNTYGGVKKAKQLSTTFRRLTKKLSKTNVTVIFVSQIRAKLDVTFGKKTQRSGGKALDFYASQVIFLAELGKRYITRRKVKKPVGIDVRAKIDKNKVGLPFREVEFPIIFGYGIDDLTAALKWADGIGRLDEVVDISKNQISSYVDSINAMPSKEKR